MLCYLTIPVSVCPSKFIKYIPSIHSKFHLFKGLASTPGTCMFTVTETGHSLAIISLALPKAGRKTQSLAYFQGHQNKFQEIPQPKGIPNISASYLIAVINTMQRAEAKCQRHKPSGKQKMRESLCPPL